MGALGREYLRRAECSNRRSATLSAYRNNLARLTDSWIWGDFETFLASRLTKPFALEVRDHLRKRAQFVAGRRINVPEGKLTPQNAPHLKWRTGYSANCVNASMWALEVMMKIAEEKGVRPRGSNPFKARIAMDERVNLPKGGRKPELPSDEMMQRLFAEMRVVQYNRSRGGDGQRKFGAVAADNPFIAHLQTIANRQADFAELFAYSGCRHEEAATLKVENIDKNAPGFLYVDGTKSKQAKRDVPIFTPLRTILDRVSKGKKPGELLFPSVKVRNRNGAVGDQRSKPFSSLPALKRACTRLGIRPLVQHELRHYFATKMVEENCTWSQLPALPTRTRRRRRQHDVWRRKQTARRPRPGRCCRRAETDRHQSGTRLCRHARSAGSSPDGRRRLQTFPG